MTDREIVNWLSDNVYLPEDHPSKGVFVCVDDTVSPPGAFTCLPSNDQKAFRDAVRIAANRQNAKVEFQEGSE